MTTVAAPEQRITTEELPEPNTTPTDVATAARKSAFKRLWAEHHLVFWTAMGGLLILSGWIASYQGRVALGRAFYVLGYLSGGWMAAKESFDGLRRYRLDVNVLMTLAAIGAAILGRWAEGGTLIFLFSLSNTLEHYALARTKAAVRSLMDLRPARARLITTSGARMVPVEELEIGAEILIKPGEKIPADGIIIVGNTSVDRSTFTGESVPIDSGPDDDVLAGTMNLTGQISVRVTARAQDTALAAIIHRVEQAQSGRVPTNSFVGWFGQRYTIGVLAGATLLTILPPLLFKHDWGASFYRSLTLLVVASPCALIISTPAAVLSALGRAARRGILFKGGEHLLALGKVKAIACDKTGTLTQAKAAVTDVIPVDGIASDDLMLYAAAVESGSNHPIAHAIFAETVARGFTVPHVEDAQTIAGNGATGTVRLNGNARKITVGNRRMMESRGVRISDEVESAMSRLEINGKTTVIVSGSEVLGLIALEDPPRPSAKTAVAELHSAGVESVWMLTGDNRLVAKAMAERLGIDNVESEMLPGQKADTVARLLRDYKSVAYVGDGVNDAPALASASVGVAMGGAKNDVVLETADIVLMGDNLSRLSYGIRLSNATRRTIIQNLVFALIVIAILLTGAFLGEIPLTLGVIGHEGSTLLVVLNSLRMLWFD